MTPKEREAIQQALYALEDLRDGWNQETGFSKEAITALREALDHFRGVTNMVGCAYCNNPLFAGTKCNNCGLVTLAEPQVDWKEEAMRLGGLNAKHVGELRKLKAEQAEQEPVGYTDSSGTAYAIRWTGKLPPNLTLYADHVRTKDLTDFGCVPNSNGTTNQRGELLSALEALLEDYIHRVQDAWIEAGGSDISREEVLTNCEPARNAAAAIANMTGATDELP